MRQTPTRIPHTAGTTETRITAERITVTPPITADGDRNSITPASTEPIRTPTRERLIWRSEQRTKVRRSLELLASGYGPLHWQEGKRAPRGLFCFEHPGAHVMSGVDPLAA